MTERRQPRNQRAADYGRALARLRDQHRAEFEELYADERNRRHQPTNNSDAKAR